MSADEPVHDPIAHAVATIRAGSPRAAAEGLLADIPDLAAERRGEAYRITGIAYWQLGEWAEALRYFLLAAEGSEIPEDHFNVAMARVKLGDLDGAEATWQRVFDLSYAHQDAPGSSTFFEKKALLAEALLDAGRPAPLALDLLERQLLPFFTNYHVTDPSFWAMRGVPDLETVLTLLRRAYRDAGRSAEAWAELCGRVAKDVDSEGAALCEAFGQEFAA